jgi:hypothetical protein
VPPEQILEALRPLFELPVEFVLPMHGPSATELASSADSRRGGSGKCNEAEQHGGRGWDRTSGPSRVKPAGFDRASMRKT